MAQVAIPKSDDRTMRRKNSGSTCGVPSGYEPMSPTPTQATNEQSPPLPQPGAVPIPKPHAMTAKAPIAPPPKVGEKAMSAEHYTAPSNLNTSSLSQQSPSPRHQTLSSPNSTLIDTNTVGMTDQTDTFSSRPAHPPGYIQNPYASDLTPDQRFAIQQEENGYQCGLPAPLGARHSRHGSSNSIGRLEEASEVWNSTKKWVTQKGGEIAEQLGDMHGKAWDAIEGKNRH